MNGQPISGLNNRSGQVPGREVMPSGAPRKFFTFSFFVFLLVVLLYFGLSVGYKAFLNQEIEGLEAALDELRFEVPPEEQNELVRFFSQVGNIEKILGDHVIASNFFQVLERNTHKQVAYTGMELSTPDRKVSLNGIAVNYDALVAQLTIFESAPEIERIILDNSQRSGGAVGFRVTLTVNRSVFDFKEPVFVPLPSSEPTETEEVEAQ